MKVILEGFCFWVRVKFFELIILFGLFKMEKKKKMEEEKSGFKKVLSAIKKTLIIIANTIATGFKKLGFFIKKKRQKREWKEKILRRLTKRRLKKLCFEQKIGTEKTVTKRDGRSGKLYSKKVECKKNDLVSRIKNRVSLEDIIDFAERKNIKIKDIKKEIRDKKQEWRMREKEKSESGFLYELEKTIREFEPPKKYELEDRYRDTLATWLRKEYPSTDIEVQRGSSRPDIVVKDVTIEVKGPTNSRDLQTLSDKCMRYSQHFSEIIVVLFDVRTNERLYEETRKGFKNQYPDSIIIRKG